MNQQKIRRAEMTKSVRC